MWPTHFNEGVAERDHFFGTDIETRSLASVAEEVTNLMIWDRVRMGPLKVGTGMSSESMIWAPALLRALLTFR